MAACPCQNLSQAFAVLRPGTTTASASKISSRLARRCANAFKIFRAPDVGDPGKDPPKSNGGWQDRLIRDAAMAVAACVLTILLSQDLESGEKLFELEHEVRLFIVCRLA